MESIPNKWIVKEKESKSKKKDKPKAESKSTDPYSVSYVATRNRTLRGVRK